MPRVIRRSPCRLAGSALESTINIFFNNNNNNNNNNNGNCNFDSLLKKARVVEHSQDYYDLCGWQRRRLSTGSTGSGIRRRRRRRRMEGEYEDDPNDSTDEVITRGSQVKKMDRKWFVSVAKDSLVEVERAMEPMVPINDIFVLKRGSNELGELLQIILSPHIGTYVIQIDEVSQTMTLNSPKSGMYTYMYDVHTQEWIGTNDGHSFKGMITRDLIQQCQGIPNF